MTETLHDTIDASPEPRDNPNPADAGAIVEAIERPNQYQPDKTVTRERPDGTVETTAVEDGKYRWLPEMDLPSFGEERETCGDEMYRFCSCCGESVEIGQTCYQSQCARCAQEWCRRAATRAAAKLSALWAYKYASLDDHPYFHHVVVSPPDDWRLADSPETVFDRTLEVVKDVMDELGIDGLPIYHPFRGEHEDPEDDDLGEWKGRVFEGREWDDVRGELEFSPHFHIIGVAPYVDIGVTERVERETGWVIHRITQQGSNVSIGNDFDMARAVSYCLSHCGIYEDSNGDNRAAYRPRCIGRSTPDGVTANDETKEEFDRIVRSVAPETLGVPYKSVACARKVPRGEGANLSVAVTAGLVDGEQGDGDGADEHDHDQEGDGDDPDLERCEGRMLNISEAPKYLNDPEWRSEASLSHVLERRYQEWKRKRGVAG